jgi:hypothetical protein
MTGRKLKAEEFVIYNLHSVTLDKDGLDEQYKYK